MYNKFQNKSFNLLPCPIGACAYLQEIDIKYCMCLCVYVYNVFHMNALCGMCLRFHFFHCFFFVLFLIYLQNSWGMCFNVNEMNKKPKKSIIKF